MYLLDTNVVSELRKIHNGKADKNVATWADGADAAELFLPVIVIHELEIGVRLVERRDKAQGAQLRMWLDKQVMPAFEGRILPISVDIALRSAQLHVPNPRPLRDGLIAATALVHKMQVVTRNVADFDPMKVPTVNPWQPRPLEG
jgi:toxin FitB